MNRFWLYSTIHKIASKVIDEQTLWGQRVCHIWLPDKHTLVRVPGSTLRPLQADEVGLGKTIEAGLDCVRTKTAWLDSDRYGRE